jgi:hypothetical protein
MLLLAACSGETGDSGDDALTNRTCEIVRDIAADASDGVDSPGEMRDRFKALLDGYGEAAPASIAAPLRSLVGALTTGDIATATDDLAQLDAACTSFGV